LVKKRFLLFYVLFLSGFLGAQDISVSAYLSQEEVFSGQQIIYTVYVEGVENWPAPDLDFPTFINGTYLGGRSHSNQGTISINGRTETQYYLAYSQNWELTFPEAGTYTIPSWEIPIQGKIYKTPPLNIKVKPPQTFEDYKLKFYTRKERYYQGEKIPLTVEFLFRKEVRGIQFNLPVLDQMPEYEPYQVPDPSKEDTFEFNYKGNRLVGKVDSLLSQGNQYSRLSYSFLYDGKSDLENNNTVSLNFKGVVSQKTVTDFFGRQRLEPVFGDLYLTSQPLQVEILPLPQRGRPTQFDGLIGPITAEAELEKTRFQVGDPIMLDITLKGLYFSRTRSLPPFYERLEWDQFKVQLLEQKSINPSEEHFQYRVRAREGDIQALPAIEIPYFDPEKGQYALFTLPSIPLQVTPAQEVLYQLDLKGDERKTEENLPSFRGFYPSSLYTITLKHRHTLWLLGVLSLLIVHLYKQRGQLNFKALQQGTLGLIRPLLFPSWRLYWEARDIEKKRDFSSWLTLWDKACRYKGVPELRNVSILKKELPENHEAQDFISDWERRIYFDPQYSIKTIPARKLIRFILRSKSS